MIAVGLFQLVNSGVFMVSGENVFVWIGAAFAILSLVTFASCFFIDGKFLEFLNRKRDKEEYLVPYDVSKDLGKIYRHPCEYILQM